MNKKGILHEIMSNYVADTTPHYHQSRSMAPVPIAPQKNLCWDIVRDPTRFHKTFEFQSAAQLQCFINSLMEYQQEVHHFSSFTAKEREITIEVYTEGVEGITEIDQDYIKVVDDIFEDSLDLA